MHHSRIPPSIVVPSRNDRFLSKLTELIGGPLGKRTQPGQIRTGFFSIERVLVILVLLSAVLALLFKDHCRQVGWLTPDQYSTTCYSGIPAAFQEHRLDLFFPYTSGQAGFDYPPLGGLIAGITAWLSGFGGTGATRVLGFFDLNALLLVIAWLLGTIALARSTRRRPWDAAVLACSPLLLFTAFSSWDLWTAALSAVGLFLFSRQRRFSAGIVLGLAGNIQPYIALILVAIILVSLRRRENFAPVIFGALLSFAISTVPALTLDPAGWLNYWSRAWTGEASTGSLYGVINDLAGRLGGSGFTPSDAFWVSMGLLVLGIVAAGLLCFGARRAPRVGSLAFVLVAWFMLIDKQAAPEHLLWLLPLLALTRPRWRSVLIWQVFGILYYLAQLLHLGVIDGDNNPQHGIDLPYYLLALLLSGVATLILMGLVVRDVLQPRYDLLRRGTVDDPLIPPRPRFDDRSVTEPGPENLVSAG